MWKKTFEAFGERIVHLLLNSRKQKPDQRDAGYCCISMEIKTAEGCKQHLWSDI